MKTVSLDKWRDAVKLLMGQGTNPTLTTGEQITLSKQLRGPFARGMTAELAVKVLRKLGWRKESPK